jgi:serine/threonine protein phosphatase PrpC
MSGTTAVVGCVRGNDLFVANVGDSRAIVCSRAADGTIQSYAVSEDHKPDLPTEKQRIESCGGRVIVTSFDDGTTGPARVFLADIDIPGLAMSRSMGDLVAHSAGVSSEPDSIHFPIASERCWVVFASDGLWEFLSNDEVAKIVVAAESPAKAVDVLIEESAARWMKNESVIDDTTVIIIELSRSSGES